MAEVKNDFLSMFFLFIVFCVTLALLHDHYQRGYSGTSRTLNSSIFIERALKRIPICSIDDRSRQRNLLNALEIWTKFAQISSIPFWISHQTLFSYVRYKNLAAHHSNIDLSILTNDLPRLLYQTEISSEFFIKFNKSNLHFVDRRSNISIRIWPHKFIDTIRTFELIFPLEPCVFAGIRVWCPFQPLKLLTSIYRQREKKFFCVNGRWIS